jgi:hypothetical protein
MIRHKITANIALSSTISLSLGTEITVNNIQKKIKNGRKQKTLINTLKK